MTANEQQQFWEQTYAKNYMSKNAEFDEKLGIEAWKQILGKTKPIKNLLECGSNIGRNIGFLNTLLPNVKKSIIEISPEAYHVVTKRFNMEKSFNGAITSSRFPANYFDLVYTMGVLIHIHPDDLLANMQKMFDYSAKYILIGEYFNRTPVMIPYQGENNKLFKCDFGKLFIQNFKVNLVDYGFLWGYIYDIAGFDDITYWLFEKK